MWTKCALAAIFVLQVCWAIPYDLTPRITDGEDATPGEFPYLVSVQWEPQPGVGYSHDCGGSILNEWYILTAGHCVHTLGELRVIAGKYYLKKNETTEQTIKVTKTFVHDEYRQKEHDIALLELEEPLIFNSKVQPIKLPAQGQEQDGDAIISGWGVTDKVSEPTVLPNKLQKAVVPILSIDRCRMEMSANGPSKQKVYITQVCTGTAGKEVSICFGDDGGPLAQGHGAAAVQVGIVSWGKMPCGATHMPSVYTRVASYVDWIHQNMH